MITAYLASLKEKSQRLLTALIAWSLPFLIRRSLERNLHGVYARGAWDVLAASAGGALLAANHHSWWDLYLVWLIRHKLRRPLSGLILPETLEQFPFFRNIGAIPTSELREALRRLRRGDLLVVFPEGELRAAGTVGEVRPGLGFLASRAAVPIYPVAIRTVMRGAQRPEVFIILGEAVSAGEVAGSLNALLGGLERELAHADPERPLLGFEAWSGGAASTNERVAWVGKLFGRRPT